MAMMEDVARMPFPRRREIAAWVSVGIIANQSLHAVSLASVDAFWTSMAAINLIYLFACFAVFRLVADIDAESRRLPWDVPFALSAAAALAASSFLGYRFGIGLATTYAGLYFVVFWHRDQAMRAAGAVLLALAAHLVWGPFLFQLFMPVIVHIDIAVARVIAALADAPVSVEGSSIYGLEGHRVAIVGGCSAFANMSSAVLAYISAVMLVRRRWARRDYLYLAGACVAMMAMNSVRLVVLGTSRPLYDYWHDGAGVPVIALSETLVIALICLVAARRRAGAG